MKIKEEKGITGVDVSVAILIVAIFTGVIMAIFYNVSLSNEAIKRNATANNIIVAIMEEIQAESYENITGTYATSVAIPNGYDVTIEAVKYKDIKEDNTLEDIVKLITVTVVYNVNKKPETVEVRTLKTI